MMGRLPRRLATAFIAAALLMAGAGPAAALPQGHIDDFTVQDGVLTLRYSAATSGKPLALDDARVTVSIQLESGQERTFPAQAQSIAGNDQTDQAVILAMDVSGSLTDKDLAATRSAARTFLANLPAPVRVGLYTFASKPHREVPLTTDRKRVSTALDRKLPKDRQRTSIYETLIQASDDLPSSGARTILLLSDGDDDSGVSSEREAVALLKKRGVTVTALGFGANLQRSKLLALTEGTGGPYISVGGVGGLAQGFSSAASGLDNRLTVTTTLPAEFIGQNASSIVVHVEDASGADLAEPAQTLGSLQQVAPTPSVVPAPPGKASPPVLVARDARLSAVTPVVLVGALVALFAALAFFVLTVLGGLAGSESAEQRVMRRLSVYTLSGRQPVKVATEEQTSKLGDNLIAKSAVDLVGKVVQRRDFDANIDARLDAAGVPLRTAEWMLIHVGSGVGVSVLFLLISRGGLAATILGLVLGLAGPWLLLGLRKSRRETAFLSQLPDTLQLVAGSLQAGYSLPQAMDAVVREARAPISTEFNRALVETRLGMVAEDALEGIARRMGSQDFEWIVMAIRIQREVGGNLAELLGTVADTLRERERLRRQVSALSAEGRLSGWILGALPVVFTVYLVLTKPEYLQPLWSTPFGQLLIVFDILLIAVGGFWMSRVVKVNV